MSASVTQLLDNIPDDEVQRIAALHRVAEIARDLWQTDPGSPDLDLIAQRIGDAARVESNRTPLGESGLLGFFCSVISTQGVRATLIVQCLRIIGNSSADNDENREKVVASGCLPSIVSLLNDDSMLAFVIPVLFNISVDYEPAQKAIYQAGINPELVSLLSGPRLGEAAALANYICKLLGFVATQEPEANLVDPATPFVLLSLADDQPSPSGVEEFLAQASVALTYLSQEQFQQAFIKTPGSINLFFHTFSTACGGLEGDPDEDDDNDHGTQLKKVRAAFTATLADLSAQPQFASLCPLDGPEVKTLQSWISSPHISLQSAACLALGNLARSDENCRYLVQQCAIHQPLIAILADTANVDASLLHSVLGFLKNLAIPAENKPVLGAASIPVLPRIWGLDTQTQVQFDAVSLTRLLLVGCPENIQSIIGIAPSEDAQQPCSKLHLLMDLNARSDQEPTQMETARAITTVCRVLHSSPGAAAADSHESLETFYSRHKKITDSMLRLGLQTKFPVLRSELLFVFALMARTPDGAKVVARAMRRAELVAVITEVITGGKATTITDANADADGGPTTDAQDGDEEKATFPTLEQFANLEAQAPTTAALTTATTPSTSITTTTTAVPAANTKKTMADIDRENALVLIAELLQRFPSNGTSNNSNHDHDDHVNKDDALPATTRRTFGKLLREGGERVLLSLSKQGETVGRELK